MGKFIHKTRITSPDILIKRLAMHSDEVKKLKRELESNEFYIQRIAKLKLDKIAECIFAARRASNGTY